MFKKIIVAYDESPEAKRALATGIDLAKQFRSQLRLITVREPLPAYMSYAEAAFPGSEQILINQRHAFYANLQKDAQAQAETHGISAEGIIVEGDEIQSLVDDLNHWQADLLVIGRRHHSSVSGRLWGSTVHEVAEKAHCSVLAVL